jgi:hypothetical protein
MEIIGKKKEIDTNVTKERQELMDHPKKNYGSRRKGKNLDT